MANYFVYAAYFPDFTGTPEYAGSPKG